MAEITARLEQWVKSRKASEVLIVEELLRSSYDEHPVALDIKLYCFYGTSASSWSYDAPRGHR